MGKTIEDVEMEKDMLGTVQILQPDKIDKAPDCVMETLFQKLNNIDKEIKYHEECLKALNAQYTAHVNFMKSFGAGNLSHDGSDNMIESPQPIG